MIENKFKKLTYDELNLIFINKLKLKNFYLKAIKICPNSFLKSFFAKALKDVESDIERIKSVEYESNDLILCSNK